jgi:glycosyltransferase involved in cell wall biosynthesis
VRAAVVLHVPESPFGPASIRYRRIADAAARRGNTLDVVTADRFPFVTRFHPRFRVLLFPFVVAAWLWRHRREYDVVLFHSYAGWVFNLFAAGVPTVTAFHGLEPLEFIELDADHRTRGKRLSIRYRLVHGWMMKKVLRLSCRRSAHVTCSNAEERQYLLDHGWATPGRLSVQSHGVPAFFFVDDREFAPRATRLLIVSQWIDRKGIRHVVDAFSSLARKYDDVELVCCGTIVPESGVRHDFPPDVRARVTVKPSLVQSELASVDRDADIFIHAALTEGYGNAIAEAMAAALPIVVTPVGVAIDFLEHERDCLIVPKGDPEALAAAIERLLDDAALRRRLGTAARRSAEALRTVDGDTAVIALLEGAA